jgi:PIN domain nuclease of toxin-antitoxin system
VSDPGSPPRYLLDTHVLAWWLGDLRQLRPAVRDVIADPSNTILVSTVSVWEMAQKHGRGRWPEIEAFLADAEAILREERMPVLPLTLAHALAAGALDWAHRDPFDRMLAAQALAEKATLVTADRVFATVAPASGLALMVG